MERNLQECSTVWMQPIKHHRPNAAVLSNHSKKNKNASRKHASSKKQAKYASSSLHIFGGRTFMDSFSPVELSSRALQH